MGLIFECVELGGDGGNHWKVNLVSEVTHTFLFPVPIQNIRLSQGLCAISIVCNNLCFFMVTVNRST